MADKNFLIKNGLTVGSTERISSAGVITGSLSGSLASATTATTQSASDNSTKIATTAYTDAAITALVDSSPGALNTLNELAAALGDDANFSTTVTNSIATKLPLAGGTLTGNLTAPNLTLDSGAPGPHLSFENVGGSTRIKESDSASFYYQAYNHTFEGHTGIDRLHISQIGDVSFYEDTGTTAKFFWDASAESLGIGESTPLGKLHVKTADSGASVNSNADELVVEGSGTAGITILSGTTGDGNLFFDDSGGFARGKLSYSHNGDYLSILSSGASLFYNGGSERMRILSGGNVGIGTNDPDTKLHVFTAGHFKVDTGASPIVELANNSATGSTAGTATLKFTQANTQAGGKIVSGRDGGYSDGSTRQTHMAFYTATTASDTEKMRITSTGNVHINTGLDARVQLGTSGTGANSVSDNSVYVRGNDDDLILGSAGNGNIIFKENAATRMFIKSGGNVGIGETNPDYQLHIAGGGDFLVEDTGNGSAHIRLRSSSGGTASSNWKLKTGSNNYFYIDNDTGSAGTAIAIDNTGNVGMGTSTPGSNHAKANNLVVGSGSAGGMAVYNGTAEGWYAFSRSNANNTDAYDGGMSYTDRVLRLHTNAGSTRLKIDGTGDTEIYGHLSFEDNKLLMFGGGQDARLYFDASTNALFITAANGTANTVNITTNNFTIGGATALISGTANESVVINQEGASNVDFRVESDNEQYNFFCDASSEIIHFGEGTNSDVQSVIPARTLMGRRHGYHGGNKQHAGQTFKYCESTGWTDAIKIDWHNVSWGAVCMRITGQYYYSASDNFSIVIGFQGYGQEGSSSYGHNSVSYDATSNGAMNWTSAIQLAQTAVGETMIRQRAGDTTGDVIYRYEWQCYARSNQPILIIEQ